MKLDIGGNQINIERSGNPSGQTVMMAHSLGCSLRMWDPQMAVLEPDFDIVRLDMRGHGQSDTPSDSCTLDELADDVIAVMDQLKLDKVLWVGLSIGGMIGQSLLLRYPERLLSAVLCNTMGALPDGVMGIWDERIKKVETEGLGSIKQLTLERWFTPAFLAAGGKGVDEVGKQIDQASDRGYVACCRAITGLDYIERLSEVSLQVLIIAGAQDMATPLAASQAMHEHLPNSTLVALDDAAHISNVEQTAAFNEALLPFLHNSIPG